MLAAHTLSVRGALLVLLVLPQQLAVSRSVPTLLETALFWTIWRAFPGGVVSAMAEHAAIIAMIMGAAALIGHALHR